MKVNTSENVNFKRKSGYLAICCGRSRIWRPDAHSHRPLFSLTHNAVIRQFLSGERRARCRACEHAAAP